MDIELVTSSPKLESLCLEENPLTREAEANAESEAAANAGITIREEAVTQWTSHLANFL